MFDILLEAALRATVIAVVAAAALWSLRVRAAAVRHRVWTVVLAAMLALPVAIMWAPDVPLRVLPPASGAVAAPRDFTGAAVAGATVIRAGSAAIDAKVGLVELAPATPSWSWRAWLATLYVAGAAILLARLAIGTVRVGFLGREATVVNGMLTSTRIGTPFTFGLIRPKILLPAGWQRWPAARLGVVLEHERAHVARRDPFVQWLALLNRAVFWFHPLAWWLERHLAAAAEEACDAVVLARGHGAADYSQHLLELARPVGSRPLPTLVGMPMPGNGLGRRIAKILEDGVGRPASRSTEACAAALAALAAAALGTITLAQAPTPLRAHQPTPPLAQQTAPPLAQPTDRPRAQSTDGPRNLLEVYELALAIDSAVH
jgi:beta-lactamase regulating signal transducer with metallopeptidase domain